MSQSSISFRTKTAFCFPVSRDGHHLEEAGELAALERVRRLGSRHLLAQPHEVERGAVRLFAAAGAAEKVDREVRRDAVKPGVEGVLLVVPRQLLPDPQEDELGDVAGVLAVADDPAGDRDDGGGLSGDEGLESDGVAPPGAQGEVAVGKLGGFLSVPTFAVYELHRSP